MERALLTQPRDPVLVLVAFGRVGVPLLGGVLATVVEGRPPPDPRHPFAVVGADEVVRGLRADRELDAERQVLVEPVAEPLLVVVGYEPLLAGNITENDVMENISDML